MDLISVIIPVYKVEAYLHRCFESVINQTYANLEIFLVDDGSPDNCPAMCDEYAAKDSRIKVIHKKNGGLSDARNAALDVMTGDYVTFVDSDDYLAPDAIETMYSALIRNDADIAVGNMMGFDENNNTGYVFPPYDKETLLTGKEMLALINQPSAHNKLYRSRIFETLRYPYGKIFEDLLIWHIILSDIDRCIMTGKTAYHYFIRSGSIMHSKYSVRNTDDIEAYKSRYEWLESIGEHELANENRMFVYSNYARAFSLLDRTDLKNAARLDEISVIYKECYKILIKEKTIPIKQKIRMYFMYRFPELHTKLFMK